ncbi:unnamed protein product [Symbiodinium sp. CCMP2592]|nr:unnamed protein product [Symbiodinium sp. CCMP2592]
MDAPAKMKVMDTATGEKQADSLKIANAIRPAIENRLDELRDDKDRCICSVDGTKANGDDVSRRPDYNYELLKVYVVNLTSGVFNAKQLLPCLAHRVHIPVAVLYLSCVYGFWTGQELKQRGRKGEIKAGREWAVVQGSNVRKLAAYVMTALQRTPYARTEEMMVLKTLHQRINRTVVPERPNRRSTRAAIEDEGQESQSSSTTSCSAGSTIDLLDSDDDGECAVDDDREMAPDDDHEVASRDDREMAGYNREVAFRNYHICMHENMYIPCLLTESPYKTL